jgi:hypothetical protein
MREAPTAAASGRVAAAPHRTSNRPARTRPVARADGWRGRNDHPTRLPNVADRRTEEDEQNDAFRRSALRLNSADHTALAPDAAERTAVPPKCAREM